MASDDAGERAADPAAPVRDTSRWYQRGTGSPYAGEQRAQSRTPGWDWSYRIISAADDVAARLGIQAGEQVVESRYLFTADGVPTVLSTSWEPHALTAGTAILVPEEGPYAGMGVLDRFAAIGLVASHVTEKVTSRAATGTEAESLAVQPGSPVLEIERTYFRGRQALETATIVAPEGYRAVYELPVRDAN